MAKSRVDGDLHITGSMTASEVRLPAGTVTDEAVAAGTGIDATKLEHQFPVRYQQADGSDVADAIVPIHTVNGTTATIVNVDVACIDAPDGGDKAFTVDLKKCNAGTPTPATVLDSVVTISSADADCEVNEATISSASLAAGDTLVVAVATSGSTGNQGQGLIVTVTLREDPQ